MDRLLRSAGFAVLTFNSADEFLECERPLGNDCFVVGIHMPGMNPIRGLLVSHTVLLRAIGGSETNKPR